MAKHFLYTGGWKKFEAVWNFLIKTGNLNNMLPVLESILAKVKYSPGTQAETKQHFESVNIASTLNQ